MAVAVAYVRSMFRFADANAASTPGSSTSKAPPFGSAMSSVARCWRSRSETFADASDCRIVNRDHLGVVTGRWNLRTGVDHSVDCCIDSVTAAAVHLRWNIEGLPSFADETPFRPRLDRNLF